MTAPFRTSRHAFLSPTDEIIDEARNGRMFILVDDEDRENEGDLVIPAQMATPAAINFMATHGKGLICLALGKERVDQLGLNLMSRQNGTRHETAFTVSIEARDGVTTGISAGDRARTVAVAIDAAKGPEHIVTPGHVFPLIAKPGGVLVRAGHTEAAVDVSRLAGLNPSGVICEIMKEDRTMARLDDLAGFAQLRRNAPMRLRLWGPYLRSRAHVTPATIKARIKSAPKIRTNMRGSSPEISNGPYWRILAILRPDKMGGASYRGGDGFARLLSRSFRTRRCTYTHHSSPREDVSA